MNSHTTTMPSSSLEHQGFYLFSLHMWICNQNRLHFIFNQHQSKKRGLGGFSYNNGIFRFGIERGRSRLGYRNNVMEDLDLEAREEDGVLDSRIRDDNEMGDHNVMELTEPKVGMIFESEIQAKQFYSTYARAIGFGVTISNSKKRNGIRYWMHLSCHKNRLAKKPVDPMASHPTTKTNCKATMKIARQFDDKWKVNSINLDHNHDMDLKATKYLRCYRNLPAHIQRDIELNCEMGIEINKTVKRITMEVRGAM